jgi:hypothetical protein
MATQWSYLDTRKYIYKNFNEMNIKSLHNDF